MERADGGRTAQTVSGLSLLVAMITFLAMWGGVTLLLTDPHGVSLPPPTSTPRGLLVSLLLFWVPVGTGAIACLSGLVGLSVAGGRQADAQRRALIGIFLGLAPVCLAAAWLGWVLASSTR